MEFRLQVKIEKKKRKNRNHVHCPFHRLFMSWVKTIKMMQQIWKDSYIRVFDSPKTVHIIETLNLKNWTLLFRDEKLKEESSRKQYARMLKQFNAQTWHRNWKISKCLLGVFSHVHHHIHTNTYNTQSERTGVCVYLNVDANSIFLKSLPAKVFERFKTFFEVGQWFTLSVCNLFISNIVLCMWVT